MGGGSQHFASCIWSQAPASLPEGGGLYWRRGVDGVGERGLDLLGTSPSWCSAGFCHLEPVIGSGSGSVALWWRVLPSLWDRGWDSPGFLRPTGLRQLPPFYREAGDGRRRHSLSITVIAGGFYEPVMGSESGQLSVLLSQLGDLLMGGGGGARCHELCSGSLLCRGCPVCAQLQQAGWGSDLRKNFPEE